MEKRNSIGLLAAVLKRADSPACTEEVIYLSVL